MFWRERDLSRTGNDSCRLENPTETVATRALITSDAAMRVTEMLLSMAILAIAAPAVHADCLTNTDVESFFLGVVRRATRSDGG